MAYISKLQENEFDLNLPVCGNISEPEEEIDIRDAYDKLKKTYVEQDKPKKLIGMDFKELRMKL